MQNNAPIPNALHHKEESFPGPYQEIAKFFDIYSLADIRKRISAWMETVNKKAYWRERHPSNLNFFYENLSKLIKAIYQIYRENKTGKPALELLKEKGYDVETNLLHPALYFGWASNETIWDHFPRHLIIEEYIDPYLVFPKFFALYDCIGWHRKLYELLIIVLDRNRPAKNLDRKGDLLQIQKQLLKLVEAAHLIDAREVKYKGEFKKKYPFTLDWPCSDLSITQVLKVATSEKNNLELLEEEQEWEENKEGLKEDEPCKTETCNTGHNDICDRVLSDSPQHIHIAIRGNYIVNHPAAG